jgi:hypothetical protein
MTTPIEPPTERRETAFDEMPAAAAGVRSTPGLPVASSMAGLPPDEAPEAATAAGAGPATLGGAGGGAPPPRLYGSTLNLSRRPFVNSRPVTRVALLLWLLGLLLLAGNLWLFWRYLENSQDARKKLRDAEVATDHTRRQVAQLSALLAGLNLEQQNREVAYLNRKIAERTFSWSLLLDRLAQVMPDGVRLTRLSPSPIAGPERGGREEPAAASAAEQPVSLSLTGEAKNDEVLLQFVDRLFGRSDVFLDNNLQRESREDSTLIHFDLKVQYLPTEAGRSGAAPAASASTASRRPPSRAALAPRRAAPGVRR